MDHDGAFKELLSIFFIEFVELFLPDVAEYLDPNSLEFLNQEVFTNVRGRTKRVVDLLVKARFRGQETFFIVHVENQSSADSDFPKRMFHYFSRLHEKHDLPIYPVVIFSYDEPMRSEPNRYEVTFPGQSVLKFTYTRIQLNRLPWRKFVTKLNPVATALLVKMKIAPKDRPKVLSQCARMLATLRLDPARSELIWTFAENYLKLTGDEIKQYERELAKLDPHDQEATMQLISSFRREAMESVIVRLMNRRFGSVSPEIKKRLDTLSPDELDELTDNLFDFTSTVDVENWLVRHKSNGNYVPPQ